MLKVFALSGLLMCGCGSALGSAPAAAAPTIAASPALNGAQLVRLVSTTPDAKIYYTVDGSVPTTSSQIYEAPFLVVSKLTVKAIAADADGAASRVTTQTFEPAIAPGTLVWSDEFAYSGSGQGQPDPKIWTYDTGNDGFGNHELENYCAWGSNVSPCSTARPNAFVGNDGYLHIKAQRTSAGVYTSSRLKTQGLFSFQYGRFEVRAQVPEAQGLWPAAWLMGNNIVTVDWPACGEQDVLERVNAAKFPDWNEGSVHGIGFTGDIGLGKVYNFTGNETAAGWHTYGMIWSKGSVAYYVDDPSHPYVTYTIDNMKDLSKAVWPFDAAQSNFILLNLAVGGDWPGAPNATTPFPAEMLVDYVRIYAN